MKKVLALLFVGFSVFVLSACGESEDKDQTSNDVNDKEEVSEVVSDDEEETIEDEMIYLTLEELAEFDGTDGKEGYIAVDGNIYDVTDSNLWRDGTHNGYAAGQDLTDPILNQSPHGLSTLGNVPLIGELVE